MTSFTGPWLSEDEVLHHRMESFHRQRVEAVNGENSLLTVRGGGILVLHLIPQSCVCVGAPASTGRSSKNTETASTHPEAVAVIRIRGLTWMAC